jgi:hypothetical protein
LNCRLAGLVVVTLTFFACGGSTTPGTDAGNTAPDASTSLPNSYSLDGTSTTAAAVRCAGDLIGGSASNRTAFQFVFKGTPTAGLYAVEPATDRASRPVADGGVVVSYGSDPQGGPKVEQIGQSGSITVDLVGGKLHAVATAIPAKDLATSAAGTIAGDLTCP